MDKIINSACSKDISIDNAGGVLIKDFDAAQEVCHVLQSNLNMQGLISRMLN
jgi:hypothetical protein